MVGACAFLLGSVYFIHEDGIEKGKLIVQKVFDDYKAGAASKAAQLKEEYDAEQAIHRSKTSEISSALEREKVARINDLAQLRAEYSKRLRSSEDRASVYKRQAEAGPASCERLAGYAAELDRALEEGRSLVRELGNTIRLRDEQLIQLGLQIQADRLLFEDKK